MLYPVWEREKVDITLVNNSGGHVSLNPVDWPIRADLNSTVSFKLTVEAGYELPTVTVDGSTLGAALGMAVIAKGGRQPLSVGRAVAVVFVPGIWNGPIVGGVIAYSTGAFWAALPLNSRQIAAEEALVMYVIGLPLLKLLPKSTAFSRAIDDLNNK